MGLQRAARPSAQLRVSMTLESAERGDSTLAT
jgi:hypothetical protein